MQKQKRKREKNNARIYKKKKKQVKNYTQALREVKCAYTPNANMADLLAGPGLIAWKQG